MVTDQNGNVVTRHDFLPFGEEIQTNQAGRNGQYGSSTDVEQKFTGQIRDAETGNDYFNARYYTSSYERFMSPDPANACADITNPQSWNAYAYALGNPLAYVDPSGMDACFTYYYTTNGPDGPTGPPVFGSNTTCYPTVPQGQNPRHQATDHRSGLDQEALAAAASRSPQRRGRLLGSRSSKPV